ncbi:hypothetical protein Glove_396g100 [Diversispora epigaea]|uniref:Small ribosomal subunit protein uS7 domain-containing protein n=1 Tax=Diversispora epigaea TaxID=1348612 RepID=A0A397H633_9GLOM|nr:hypothetical protein Glove_396g100 [Diversispora epigaea]
MEKSSCPTLCSLKIRKQTNNNPYRIIKASIEKTSPLIRLIGYKQNSKNIQIPIPLNELQKRHKAIKWKLSASDKRSGKKFSEKLAVINGITTKRIIDEEGLEEAFEADPFAEFASVDFIEVSAFTIETSVIRE